MKETAQTNWVSVVGFALCQCWIALCFFAPQLFPETDYFSFRIYEASLVVCALSLIPGIFFARRVEEIACRRRIIYVVAGCSSLGTLLVPLSVYNGMGLLVVMASAALLTGIGSAWLFIFWYRLFYQTKDMAGCVLSVAFQSLLLYVLTNFLLPPAFSPWILILLAMAMPLLSALCLRMSQPPNEPVAITYEVSSLTKVQIRALIRLGIGLFVISFVCEFMRNQYLAGYDLAYYSENVNLAMLILKLGFSAIIITSVSRDLRYVPVFYKTAFILVAFAVLFLPYLKPAIGYGVANFGAFFLKIAVLLVAFKYCQTYKISPILVFSITRITWALDLLLAYGFYRTVNQPPSHLSIDLGIITVTLGLVVMLTYLVVMSDFERASTIISIKTQEPEGSGELGKKCTSLATSGKLSKRETEVLGLIAKGRSAPRIQEELNLSINTVNSHISHIYRKLGVNSRQELLDLIEATDATNA